MEHNVETEHTVKEIRAFVISIFLQTRLLPLTIAIGQYRSYAQKS